jgi:hypothetical protein
MRLALALVTFVLAQPVQQEPESPPIFRSWKTYTAKDNAFKVKLPTNKGKLTEETRTITIEGVTVKEQSVSFAPEEGPFLRIAVFDFEGTVRLDAEQRLKILSNAAVAEVYGKLRQENDITHRNMPAKYYEIAGERGELQMLQVFRGGRVFQVRAYSRAFMLVQAGADAFFQSFELPQEGAEVGTATGNKK